MTRRGRPKTNPADKASVYVAFRLTPAQAAHLRRLRRDNETPHQTAKRLLLQTLEGHR